ncbi:MBL fold metallo-hydrolase [Lysinibacillus sp. LZ02]|uniref:MBL fold metallo-hydrolase n=1 Tax=Lysinibacillus sp. LZ02 TaxID=3420668 RepID=UPI003D3603AC
MNLIPLGVGGAFTSRFYHNNYIAEIGSKKLLIDAGTTLRTSIKKAGYSYLDIDAVWISHLHSDHVGGLEELIFQRYWHLKNDIHHPMKTHIFVHQTIYPLLRQLLSFPLENGGATVDDFCDFTVMNDEASINFEGLQLHIFDTSDTHIQGMASSGLFIRGPLGNVLFSSDVKDLQGANLIRFVNTDTVAIFQDTSFTSNGAHALFSDILAYYPKEVHSKIYAMHYNDPIEDYVAEMERAGIQYVKERVAMTFSLN